LLARNFSFFWKKGLCSRLFLFLLSSNNANTLNADSFSLDVNIGATFHTLKSTLYRHRNRLYKESISTYEKSLQYWHQERKNLHLKSPFYWFCFFGFFPNDIYEIERGTNGIVIFWWYFYILVPSQLSKVAETWQLFWGHHNSIKITFKKKEVLQKIK